MTDEFTEVTNESWFSRIGGAIKGVVVGAIMFVVAFPLLYWNESNSVTTYKTLKAGAGQVITVPSDKIATENEGNLIHTSGQAVTDETLTDPLFKVSGTGFKLIRNVQMYQWKEVEKNEKRKKIGGGEETITTRSYEKTWSSSLIKSDNFEHPEKHTNPPSMAYINETFTARQAALGAFTLTQNQISQIGGTTQLEVETIPQISGKKIEKVPGGLYMRDINSEVQDTTIPQIGDFKVNFQLVPSPRDISIVAQQVGNSFSPYYIESTEREISLLENGILGAEQMFKKAQDRNKFITWIIRAAGFFLMFIGLCLILKPLSVLSDVLPILGNIVEAGTTIIAFLVALGCASLTIAICWIIVRPLIGIPLLVVTAAILALIIKKAVIRKEEAEASA